MSKHNISWWLEVIRALVALLAGIFGSLALT